MFCKPKVTKATERKRIMMTKQEPEEEEKEQPTKETEYIQEIDETTNELVVYEIKEVKRYKLRHGILLSNLATDK